MFALAKKKGREEKIRLDCAVTRFPLSTDLLIRFSNGKEKKILVCSVHGKESALVMDCSGRATCVDLYVQIVDTWSPSMKKIGVWQLGSDWLAEKKGGRIGTAAA